MRSMQGSNFHLPLVRMAKEDCFAQLKKAGISILTTTLSANSVSYKIINEPRFALLMGNEAMVYRSLIVIIESVFLVPLMLTLAEIGRQRQANLVSILKTTFVTLFKNPLFPSFYNISFFLFQLVIWKSLLSLGKINNFLWKFYDHAKD